jgi:hypothetical protein
MEQEAERDAEKPKKKKKFVSLNLWQYKQYPSGLVPSAGKAVHHLSRPASTQRPSLRELTRQRAAAWPSSSVQVVLRAAASASEGGVVNLAQVVRGEGGRQYQWEGPRRRSGEGVRGARETGAELHVRGS